LKRYEKESLLKNFFVFFSLLIVLLILLFIELYETQKIEYNQHLLYEMQVCSYEVECEQFVFDFVPKEGKVTHKLFYNEGAYAYFIVPQSQKYYMKILYAKEGIASDMLKIKETLLFKFIVASLLLLFISLIFTFYSLNPLRKALQLNHEFVKDILHDFNTPISSIVLNIKLFKDEYRENAHVIRLSKSVDNLLLLQQNLKSFLYSSPLQLEKVNIAHVAKERLDAIALNYPHLQYTFKQNNRLVKQTHSKLLVRILNNLLSNATKYNTSKGSVMIVVDKEQLSIIDTGKGIQNVSKVFQRYYKEQTRGIGLGLHIVKKLCDELSIKITIESQVNVGTTVNLDFRQLQEA
jgi:two-component system OmpR family sensor kinase